MADILNKIVDYKRGELEHARRQISIKDVRNMACDSEPARNFLAGFNKTDLNIIAEVKKASPSAGVIRKFFDPVAIARSYEEGGAKALSVLTDEHFFQGHLDYLNAIKKVVKLPALRKDFTLDQYQIYEARAAGADAILLIVAILEEQQIKDYVQLAFELGMTALVEVHDARELEMAVNAKAKLLGVNNRDLRTFTTNIETTLELLARCPKEIPLISESGLKDHDTLTKLHKAGAFGFLIGESFMREDNVEAALRRMLGQ
jgi:indole-3-glycerol phosphate synthase